MVLRWDVQGDCSREWRWQLERPTCRQYRGCKTALSVARMWMIGVSIEVACQRRGWSRTTGTLEEYQKKLINDECSVCETSYM